jgi:hypothetical protein
VLAIASRDRKLWVLIFPGSERCQPAVFGSLPKTLLAHAFSQSPLQRGLGKLLP